MKIKYHLIVILLLGIIHKQVAQNFATGCILDEQKYSSILLGYPLTRDIYSSSPPSYSLKPYCPKPNDQGEQGSCVGWSTCYGARTILENIRLDRRNYTENPNDAFSPSFIYNQIRVSQDCSNGASISDALNLLTIQGGLKLSDFPYDCWSFPKTIHKQNAYSNRIRGYQRLGGYGRIPIDAIKKSISENKPVVIGMTCWKSFSYPQYGFWTGIQDINRGGHAMCVIGYDDNKKGGAFEILNSWGSDWANSGYIWVKYDDFYSNVNEAYETFDYQRPEPEPKPEPKPIVSTELKGSLRLLQNDGNEMSAALNSIVLRDFDIVSAENSTYKMSKAYSSGTQFRIYFTSNEPAYIYLISYGSATKKVKPFFPFAQYSAFFGYKNTEVAIPNEDYYIAMDNNVGTDYLCILYSKESLDIQAITQSIQSKSGGFVSRLKSALNNRIIEPNKIRFEPNNISFAAKSLTKSIVPIIVEFEHKS